MLEEREREGGIVWVDTKKERKGKRERETFSKLSPILMGIQKKKQVMPDLKSSGYASHSSLWAFKKRFFVYKFDFWGFFV